MAKRAFNVPELLTWVTALIAGLQPGTLNGLTQALVAGTVYNIPDLVTKLTQIQAMLQAVVKAETALDAAVENLNEQGDAAELFIQQTRAALKGAIGKKSTALATFGMAPDKTPAPLTVDAQAAKVARAGATRAARHTVGPKAKAKIKGQVPAVAPAAPAAPPAAAPKTGT